MAGKRPTVSKEAPVISKSVSAMDTANGERVQTVPQRRKPPTSYLDEVLAARSAKRKKKKNKKEKTGQAEGESEDVDS